MYAATQQQQQPMYVNGSPYHWDHHQLRGKAFLSSNI
jgi:hypothetical protein